MIKNRHTWQNHSFIPKPFAHRWQPDTNNDQFCGKWNPSFRNGFHQRSWLEKAFNDSLLEKVCLEEANLQGKEGSAAAIASTSYSDSRGQKPAGWKSHWNEAGTESINYRSGVFTEIICRWSRSRSQNVLALWLLVKKCDGALSLNVTSCKVQLLKHNIPSELCRKCKTRDLTLHIRDEIPSILAQSVQRKSTRQEPHARHR